MWGGCVWGAGGGGPPPPQSTCDWRQAGMCGGRQAERWRTGRTESQTHPCGDSIFIRTLQRRKHTKEWAEQKHKAVAELARTCAAEALPTVRERRAQSNSGPGSGNSCDYGTGTGTGGSERPGHVVQFGAQTSAHPHARTRRQCRRPDKSATCRRECVAWAGFGVAWQGDGMSAARPGLQATALPALTTLPLPVPPRSPSPGPPPPPLPPPIWSTFPDMSSMQWKPGSPAPSAVGQRCLGQCIARHHFEPGAGPGRSPIRDDALRRARRVDVRSAVGAPLTRVGKHRAGLLADGHKVVGVGHDPGGDQAPPGCGEEREGRWRDC